MTDSDAALVERCLAGDQPAMFQFVDRFHGMIFGLCLRMLGRREDAEDVSQDVFLRTFRNLHRWDPDRPITPWLTTITANRCRSILLTRTRQLPATDNVAAVPAPQSASVDLTDDLNLALKSLRPGPRRAFELFYREEMSVAEIALEMDLPAGTIKTWLFRARRDLAAQLSRRGWSGGEHRDS